MSDIALEQQSITRKPSAFEKRIHEIDFLRGLLIMLVLMDHLFWCLRTYNLDWFYASGGAITSYSYDGIVYNETFSGGNSFFFWVYHVSNFYFGSLWREIVRYICLFLFCFLSGISTAFSKNNWARAGQMIGVYALIAVGSNLLNASKILGEGFGTIIDFNVIGVLAFSTLAYCFIQKRSWKALLAATLLFFLFWWYTLPWLYDTPMGDARAPALWARYSDDFADWMPLFPYIIFYFMGTLFSYFLYVPTRKSLFKRRGNWERPFCFFGRHSLILYLAHQFVFTPIFMIITAILGY